MLKNPTTHLTAHLRVGAIALALFVSMTTTTSAIAKDGPADLDIAVIVKATTSSYWQEVFKGAGAAAKDLGVHLTRSGAAQESQIAQQISTLESAIAKQPDAIVIAPTAAKPLSSGIERASNSGIPVVVMDSAADTKDYAAFVATDNHAAGEQAGRQFVAVLKNKHGKAAGDIAYLTSSPGVGSLTKRDKGFLDVIKKHPNIHVVAHRYGKADAANALQTTEELLTAHPDLVGVFADNNLMADGAGKVFASNKAAKGKVLVSFDSDSKILSYIKNGAIDASIVQDPYLIGFDSVMFAVMAHYGAKLPRFTNTGARTITQGNIDSKKLHGFLHPDERSLEPYLGPSHE